MASADRSFQVEFLIPPPHSRPQQAGRPSSEPLPPLATERLSLDRRPPHSQRNTSTWKVRFICSAHRSRRPRLEIFLGSDRSRPLFALEPTIASRQLDAGARTPWYVHGCLPGERISAHSRSRKPRTLNTACVRPSEYGCRKRYRIRPRPSWPSLSVTRGAGQRRGRDPPVDPCDSTAHSSPRATSFPRHSQP